MCLDVTSETIRKPERSGNANPLSHDLGYHTLFGAVGVNRRYKLCKTDLDTIAVVKSTNKASLENGFKRSCRASFYTHGRPDLIVIQTPMALWTAMVIQTPVVILKVMAM